MKRCVGVIVPSPILVPSSNNNELPIFDGLVHLGINCVVPVPVTIPAPEILLQRPVPTPAPLSINILFNPSVPS